MVGISHGLVLLTLLTVSYGQYYQPQQPPLANNWRGGYVGQWPPPQQMRPRQQQPPNSWGQSNYYQNRPQQQQRPIYSQWQPRIDNARKGWRPVKTGYYRPQPQQPRPPYSNGYGQQYDDPSSYPEVVARCDPQYCYYSCRMRLLGGGKCTKGGCMCYAGFFDYDGSPLSNFYAEDAIWYSLSEEQQVNIRSELAKFSDNPVKPTSRPNFNGGGDSGGIGGGSYIRPTVRPPYVRPTRPPITARPPYNRPTYRPPYVTDRPPYVTDRPQFNRPPTARPPYNNNMPLATARPPYNNNMPIGGAGGGFSIDGNGFDEGSGGFGDDDNYVYEDDEDDGGGFGGFGGFGNNDDEEIDDLFG